MREAQIYLREERITNRDLPRRIWAMGKGKTRHWLMGCCYYCQDNHFRHQYSLNKELPCFFLEKTPLIPHVGWGISLSGIFCYRRKRPHSSSDSRKYEHVEIGICRKSSEWNLESEFLASDGCTCNCCRSNGWAEVLSVENKQMMTCWDSVLVCGGDGSLLFLQHFLLTIFLKKHLWEIYYILFLKRTG